MADLPLNYLFSQLQEFKWRDVSFPAVNFSVELRQDLAVHKYADRDGAHVEPTGRAPLQFKARIPFLNTIVPGPVESWGTLYPDGFRSFMSAAADRTRGPLQHPEFGIVQCQLESAQAVWDAEHASSGVFVEASWIESTFTPEESADIFTAASPIGSANVSAVDLDADIQGFMPQLPDSGISLTSFFTNAVASIRSIGDQASLLEKRVGGTVDTLTYSVNSISQSLDSAVTTKVGTSTTTTFTAGSLKGVTAYGPAALFWPMRNNTTALQVSLSDLKAQLLTSNKRIGLYAVPMDATLAALSIDVGANISDLITLNKPLVASPIVPRGSIVRYYLT